PDFTTKDAKKADVSETVSEFSTGYSSEPNRDTNLRVASKKVSGTVLQPGEQFSLNDTLGPPTAAHGDKATGVSADGQMEEAVGGAVLAQRHPGTAHRGQRIQGRGCHLRRTDEGRLRWRGLAGVDDAVQRRVLRRVRSR